MDSTAVAQYISIGFAIVLALGSVAYKIIHGRINKINDKHDKLNEIVLTDCIHKDDYHRDICEMKDDMKEIKKILMEHWKSE